MVNKCDGRTDGITLHTPRLHTKCCAVTTKVKNCKELLSGRETLSVMTMAVCLSQHLSQLIHDAVVTHRLTCIHQRAPLLITTQQSLARGLSCQTTRTAHFLYQQNVQKRVNPMMPTVAIWVQL